MYEVVDYRNCDCDYEDCPGEKERVLFQHKDKPVCIDFMLRKGCEDHITKIKQYNDTKDKIDIYFMFGRMEGRRRLRVQEVKHGN